MTRILTAALLALALAGCAKDGIIQVEGQGYRCDLRGVAAATPNTGAVSAQAWCGARIPGDGPGILGLIRGEAITVTMEAGESYEDAVARALWLLTGTESPTN